MLIRLQSSEGTKRIQCDPDDTTSSLYYKAQEAYELDDIFGFHLYQDAQKSRQILMHERKYLTDYNLKHGDFVYLDADKSPTINNGLDTSELYKPFKTDDIRPGQLEPIDALLLKRDGLIERKGQNCQHGPNAQCVHCAPIEPYDEDYMKEHNIKHMSFHAYLRKLQRGVDKGKFICLEDISCKIKPGCKGHPAWPDGICTKCQPSAITLNSQVYRHVDNVTFENTSIVDNFLNYWRITGNQRMGFLYGYYEPHKDVPLGIRAVVVAIYEPPQESTRDFIKIHLERLDFKDVDFVAKELGYKRVGWIFTDLIPEEKGAVKHTRNKDSYFLTSQECIMAGFFQNCHPNPCHLAKSGFFGSKFVTVCITGDKNNQIHTESYQVSNQCMALVRDDCLLPTIFPPELAYVRESSKDRYVPDVFYKAKDEYGNDVIKIARPLPIEYLLVDVPVSVPIEQTYKFNPILNAKPFPIENRLIEGHLQDFHALVQYMKQFSRDQFLQAMSDFHLLIYLASLDTISLREPLKDILQYIKNNDKQKALEWQSKEHWSTVEELMRAHSDDYSSKGRTFSSTIHSTQPSQSQPSGLSAGSSQSQQATQNSSSSTSSSSSSSISSSANQEKWPCNYCTFENETRNTSCEMCNLPK